MHKLWSGLYVLRAGRDRSVDMSVGCTGISSESHVVYNSDWYYFYYQSVRGRTTVGGFVTDDLVAVER